MLKTMLMHKKDNKGTIKFNFVISCLVFKDSIPTRAKLTIVFYFVWRENLATAPSREKPIVLHCQDPSKSHRVEDRAIFEIFSMNWKRNFKISQSKGMFSKNTLKVLKTYFLLCL